MGLNYLAFQILNLGLRNGGFTSQALERGFGCFRLFLEFCVISEAPQKGWGGKKNIRVQDRSDGLDPFSLCGRGLLEGQTC